MATRTARPGDRWLVLGLPLLAAAWLLATPWLVYTAAIESASLFGEAPSEGELGDAARRLHAAAALAAGLPALGLLLAARLGSRGGRRTFGLMLAVGAPFALLVLASHVHPGRDDPPAPRSRPACQEHSGGDTRCPGG